MSPANPERLCPLIANVGPILCARHGRPYNTEIEHLVVEAGVSPANRRAGDSALPLTTCFYNRNVIKGRPPRLNRIFQRYDPPLYFVTICTIHRQRINHLDAAHCAFRKYVMRAATEFDIATGRYVIMPDHIHLFVRGGREFILLKWVNGLKRAMSVALGHIEEHQLWQPGFFDHLLRNDESYCQKWKYVSENPVRNGLVTRTDEWPYQGEIVYIDRA